MEDDECVCSYACIEHQEGEHEQDKCLCTITCKGVHTHIQKDMNDKKGYGICTRVEILPRIGADTSCVYIREL